MVDFKASLNKGLQAAEQAESNRKEIASVFETMNEQLAEATDGKLRIECGTETRYPHALSQGLLGIAKVMASGRAVDVIRCKNPLANGGSEVLADFVMARSGYPVEIKLGGEELFCDDIKALERSLEYMLADPVVGEKIRKVMAQPIKDDELGD